MNIKTAIHPGVLLEEILKQVEISPADLSELIGMSEESIIDIINGNASITHDISISLSKVFVYYPPKLWDVLQRNYDEQ